MFTKRKKTFNSLTYGVRRTSTLEKARMENVLNLVGRNKKILDIGCDRGEVAAMLSVNDNDVEGVDISRVAVLATRKRGLQAHELDFEGNIPKSFFGKYDLVFAGEVIEHIYDTDRFLENIRKVLKNEGEFIVTTPNLATLGRRLLLLFGKNPLIESSLAKSNAGHVRYFVFSSLFDLLKKHKFYPISFSSTCVNFDVNGKYSSRFLARLFPTFGSTIIIKAKKED